MRFTALLLIALLAASPSLALAQGFTPTDALSILINPEHPRPYETVAISMRSSLVSLTSSKVTISVDGKVVEEGSGALVGYARMGGPGSRTVVRVTVAGAGQSFSKELVIRPADVSLVVEPLSTVHPFYKGMGLVPSEGRVRLVALADIRTAPGTSVASQNLIYTWKVGNQVLMNVSGIGRSSIEATAPIRYRDATVSVTVTTQDSSVVAYTETVVAPADPIIRIYRFDPLLGPLFDTAYSGAVTMLSEEETFRAVPYFFPSTPTFTWLVNSVESGGDNDITIRSTGNGTGSAVLAARATGAKMFQTAERSLSIRFGEDNPLGIFGL